jgi:transposase InsO family protein
MDVKCKENNIDHRLTKPSTPKTNGMVERANGTIKNNTILRDTFENRSGMENGLIAFLCAYNRYRRHGSLRKELNVKTPIQAVRKWYELKPEIFKTHPDVFEKKIITLESKCNQLHQQRCET